MVIEATVDGQHTRLLLDCGFSSKELDKRLAVVGLEPTDLNAILVTHEHNDHAAGAYRAAKRWRLPLHATYGTLCAAYDHISPEWQQHHDLSFVQAGQAFTIGNIRIDPIAVPHDAREPVQYRFAAAQRHLAVLTDAGHPSSHLTASLEGLHAMVLECNHDAETLKQSAYPPSLKQRILGDWGHLSNAQAAHLLGSLNTSQLGAVWCAHLSKSNNTPAMARSALAQVMQWPDEAVHVLDQEEPGQWFVV